MPTSYHVACGIGGEMLGFQRAGFRPLGGWDLCPANGKVLRRHFPSAHIITADIRDDSKLSELPTEHIDVLTISYQCQPSSTQNRTRDPADPRHKVARAMLARGISMAPTVILVENVCGFRTVKNDAGELEMEHTIKTLRSAGYAVNWYEMNSGCYTGSSRPRIFIVGSRAGSDLLRELYNQNCRAELLPLSRVLPDVPVALWHPPRCKGMGPKGQRCLIDKRSTYPCICTKCLIPPPPKERFRYSPGDAGSYEECSVPSPQDLLTLLGFPTDWLGQPELSGPRCTCPVCKGHRQPQAGRMLGRVWCPSMAQAIAERLRDPVTRAKPRVSLLAGFRPHDARPPLASAWRDYWAGAAARSRINISERQCRAYIEKQEAQTRRTVTTAAPIEHYNLDQVHIAPDAPDWARRRIRELNKQYERIFMRHSNELPRLVIDENGVEQYINFRFKDGYRPRSCPRPKDRPGSARYILLEAFCKDMLGKGLIRRNHRSRWSNRALLVAKYALNAARGGVPDSLRFCLDLSNTNNEVDMLPALHGNVEYELRKVAGHKFYIQADSASAYWSFGLTEQSKEAATVWLPFEGQWCLFSFQRLPMGARNSGTHMTEFYHRVAELNLDPKFYSNLADDWVMFGDTIEEVLAAYAAFLKMCARHNITIKPAKVKLLFREVEYYGWTLDETGIKPSPRNLEPIRKMLEPKDMSELRTVLGFFNTFSKFLVKHKVDPTTGKSRPYFYKELVSPISVKTMTAKMSAPAAADPKDSAWPPGAKCAPAPKPKPKTVVKRPFQKCWGEAERAAYEEIRALLLEGVHLFVPLRDRPFFMETDMSLMGFGITLLQYGDDGSRRTTLHFNKLWTKTERSMPAVYKEATAWAWGFEQCLPMVRSHGHVFYTKTDSLPVSWMRKGTGRRAMSQFRLAGFDDVKWELIYISGPRNVCADALSRPPMIGELKLSVKGVLQMVRRALERLPSRYRNVFVNADEDTDQVAHIVREWRREGRVIKDGLMHISPSLRGKRNIKPAEYDLAVVCPPVEVGPIVCGDLLRAGKPFICMVDSTLIDDIHQVMDGSYCNATRALLDRTSRHIYSRAQWTVIMGGFKQQPVCRQFLMDHSGRERPVFMRSAALLDPMLAPPPSADAQHRPSRNFLFKLPGLDSNIVADEFGAPADWKEEQEDEVAKLPADIQQLVHPRSGDGLLMYCADPDFGMCYVPKARRHALIDLTHRRLLHMKHSKVFAHLKRYYWWPKMRKEVDDRVSACPECQTESATRSVAHKRWRSMPLEAPRTSWCFDWKGVKASTPEWYEKAKCGYKEIGAAVDVATRLAVFFAARTRDAGELRQRVLDHVVHKHGVPLRWRSDAAGELTGKIMMTLWRQLGTKATDTGAYHPEGNALVERVNLFLNQCLRQLSDAQYRHWPRYLSSFEAAWNSHHVSSIGCTPFEAAYGTPMVTPETAGLASHLVDDDDGDIPQPDAAHVQAALTATKQSAAAWARYANRIDLYYKRKREQRLNASGHRRDFRVGDNVCVYVPPTAAEAQRRSRTAKHMSQFKGPCVVTHVDGSVYTVKLCAAPHTVYKRTLQCIAEWRAGAPVPDAAGEALDDQPLPPPPGAPAGAAPAAGQQAATAAKAMTYEPPPADTSVFSIGDFFLAKDSPLLSIWWLHRVIGVTDTYVETQIYGTWTPQVRSAKWAPVFTDPSQRICTQKVGAAWKPWTQQFDVQDLPGQVLARYVHLQDVDGNGVPCGKFDAASKDFVMHLPGTDCHVALSDKDALLSALEGVSTA